jgi:hypothetical protein
LPGPHERQGRRGAGSRDWGAFPFRPPDAWFNRKCEAGAKDPYGRRPQNRAPPAPPGTSQLPRPHTSRAASLQERPAAVHGPTGPSLKATNSATGAVPALAKYFLLVGSTGHDGPRVYLPAAASKTRKRAAYGAGAPRPPEGHVPEPQRERATLRLHLSRRLSWTRNRFDPSARIFGVGAEWSGVRGELGCGHSASMAGSRLLL